MWTIKQKWINPLSNLSKMVKIINQRRTSQTPMQIKMRVCKYNLSKCLYLELYFVFRHLKNNTPHTYTYVHFLCYSSVFASSWGHFYSRLFIGTIKLVFSYTIDSPMYSIKSTNLVTVIIAMYNGDVTGMSRCSRCNKQHSYLGLSEP
jgi:hypothetical protein